MQRKCNPKMMKMTNTDTTTREKQKAFQPTNYRNPNSS